MNRGLSPRRFFLAGLGASPGWFSSSKKQGASARRLDSNQEIAGIRPAYLAGLGASPGWFSSSKKQGAIALRLDFDLKGRDPTTRSEGPVLASGKSLVQA